VAGVVIAILLFWFREVTGFILIHLCATQHSLTMSQQKWICHCAISNVLITALRTCCSIQSATSMGKGRSTMVIATSLGQFSRESPVPTGAVHCFCLGHSHSPYITFTADYVAIKLQSIKLFFPKANNITTSLNSTVSNPLVLTRLFKLFQKSTLVPQAQYLVVTAFGKIRHSLVYTP
jgi:hypothetical protein